MKFDCIRWFADRNFDVREIELLRKLLATGEVLFNEGEPPQSAYLIEHGSLEIRVRRAGRPGEQLRSLLLAVLGPGELVGEMSVADHSFRTASAVALADTTLLVIDSEQIRDRLADADPIIRMLFEGQIKRYRNMLTLICGSDLAKPDPLLDSSAPDAEDSALEKFRLESHLRDALSNRKLDVCFQPVLEISTKRIAGYEALVRWDHPSRGVVSPAEFIRLAEETSLIVPVGEYVLDEACIALDRMREIPMQFVAVNVSARQLADAGLFHRLAGRLASQHLPRGCLKLEITESRDLDCEQVAAIIRNCHDEGITVSLDDFGTGYSNLTHLHRLDFDTIKIDQAFVRAMFASERAMSIVRAVVALGHAIGADLVAEGVETPAQLEQLGMMGCRYAQGYLIGKAERLDVILASN